MSMRHTSFDAAISRVAEDALRGFSEAERVSFALKIMLDATSLDTVSALNWAARRVAEHSSVLVREAFERECG